MGQILVRSGSSEKLQFHIQKYTSKRFFLVTGKKSFVESGAKEFIKNTKLDYIRFSEFESNPKYEDTLVGVKQFLESECDVIVAIGGGSVIDMAKLISAFAKENTIDYLNILKGVKQKEEVSIPIIAIPTTSGTGSEATHFAVCYLNNKKYSLAHSSILPKVSILNTELIINQNPYLKACTGLDALAQAIESYWSVNSTVESSKFAIESIEVLIENLEKSVFSDDEIINEKISNAAYLAGKAINITKTTAPHAISYSISTGYNIPHGHAVFFTLPTFVEYNYMVDSHSCNDSRGYEFVKNNIENLFTLLKVNNHIEARHRLEEIAKNIGVDINFKSIGVHAKQLDKILDDVNEDRLKNNPRKLNVEALKKILL